MAAGLLRIAVVSSGFDAMDSLRQIDRPAEACSPGGADAREATEAN